MTVITVRGTPAPKGSARAMLIRGRARLIASSSNSNAKKQRSWADAVRDAAQCSVIDGPVWVAITFRVARPKGHFGARGLKPSAPALPTVYPDIDKLTRCTLDALTGVAITDDSRIVSLYVNKRYANDNAPEGALIRVGAWEKSK